MPKTFYSIALPQTSLEFIGIVYKSRSDPEVHVYIGNPTIQQRPCVHIGVDEKTHEANLYALDYAATCNIERNMPGGKEGTIPMLHGAIQLARHVDPQLKRLTFTDNSGFYPKPHQHVILSDWSILQYGQTWYERALHPYPMHPQNKKDRSLVNEYRDILQDYERFEPEMRKDRDYNRSHSWNEYFQMKKQSHTDDSFLVYNQDMLPIMRRLFKLPTLYGITWRANITSYISDPFFTIRPLSKNTHKGFKVFWGGRRNIGQGPWDSLGKYE